MSSEDTFYHRTCHILVKVALTSCQHGAAPVRQAMGNRTQKSDSAIGQPNRLYIVKEAWKQTVHIYKVKFSHS